MFKMTVVHQRVWTLVFSFSLLISCSKSDDDNNEDPDSPAKETSEFIAQPRTTNIFGFPLSNPACRIKKMTDSSTSLVTDFIYDTKGRLMKQATTEGTQKDTTYYYYDQSSRLTKIQEDGEEWTINYETGGNRATQIVKKYSPTNITTINVTYPSNTKVVLSVAEPASNSTFKTTIEFDSQYNPVRDTGVLVNNANNKVTLFTSMSTSFDATVLNPFYMYGSDYLYISGIGELYQGLTFISGTKLGTSLRLKDFTYTPTGIYDITCVVLEKNAQNYPTKVRTAQTSGEIERTTIEYTTR